MKCQDRSSFLSWLPGESLYSLCSRQHRMWGYAHCWETSERLFGCAKGGAHHDLPNHLEDLCERSGQRWGCASDIARERTLLKFYAAFISPDVLDGCMKAMAGPSVAHLKFRLGLLTSRFRANHPLKACIACIRDDVQASGWPSWHLMHQYPGIWVCQRHGTLLQESLFKSTGVARFQWLLPIESQLRWPLAGKSRTSLGDPSQAAVNFAFLVVELVDSEKLIATSRLHSVYRRELDRRGLITSEGRVRLKQVADDFLAHALALRAAPDLGAFPASVQQARDHAARLLRPPRTGTHPLRHLLMISWLYPDAAAFWEAYARDASEPVCEAREPPAGAGSRGRAGDDSRKPHLISLLRLGISVTAASARVGVDTVTGMAWSAESGIATPRRPKRLKGGVRANIVTELATGGDRHAIAAAYGISESTVTRLLRTEVGLKADWKNANDRLIRNAARQKWLQAIEVHGRLGIKRVRMLEPSTYAWLYRNDRAWLQQHKPRRETRTELRSYVSWGDRDERLSAQLVLAVASLASERKHLPLWRLYQAVPDLKPQLRVLSRLPLTRRVIDDAMKGAR